MTNVEPELPTSARHKMRIPLQIGGLPPEIQLELEETLLPSPNSVDLVDSPRAAYLNRLLAREPHVAEVFHLNSCLTRSSPANQVPPSSLSEATREWYLATSYRPLAGDVDEAAARQYGVRLELDDLPQGLSAFLRDLSASNPDESSLYAVDLWLVVDRGVYRLPARTGQLWKERDLEPKDLDAFSRCLFVDHTDAPEAAIVWVGVPWRHMVFRGPRGYRHTLIELGRQLRIADELARGRRMSISSTIDFHDDQLNDLLALDGSEHAVVAVSLLSSNTMEDS